MRRFVRAFGPTLVVAVLVVPLSASAPVRSALPSNPWTGKWTNGAGNVTTLTQGGSSINGTAYRACDRNPTGVVVKGTVTSADGATADFTYTGKPTCPGEEGKFTGVMSADGQTIRATGVTQFGTPFTDTLRYSGGGTEPRVAPSGLPGTIGVVFDGEVAVRRGSGAWTPLSKGDKLGATDQIGVGVDSHAILTFPDGSTLRLGQLTQIHVAQVLNAADRRRVEIQLRIGEVQATVAPRQTVDTNFDIKSPTSTASVRGTVFKVFYDPGSKASVVSVTQGVVVVDPSRAGLPTVSLTASKEIEVTAAAMSKVAPLGKAGAVGGVNRVRAVQLVTTILARQSARCGFPARGMTFAAGRSGRAWLVTVTVAGKLRGKTAWRVTRTTATPANALAKRVASGCR